MDRTTSIKFDEVPSEPIKTPRRGSGIGITPPQKLNMATADVPRRRDSDLGIFPTQKSSNMLNEPRKLNSRSRPIPLPRNIKSVDLDAKPLPPSRSFSLCIENPLYCDISSVNACVPPPPASSQNNYTFASGNCYEEVAYKETERDCEVSNLDQNLYGTVTDPKSLILDSAQLLTNIQFQSPIENTDISLNTVCPQSSPSSFPSWEDCDFDPPTFPPPVLSSSEYTVEVFTDSDFQESVPTIPPRPQSSISSCSDGSENLNFEVKPKLPAKTSVGSITSPVAQLPSRLVPTRKAPVPPEAADRKNKFHPPKPPRKSKAVQSKIPSQSLFPYKDYLYITGSHFSKQGKHFFISYHVIQF